MINRTRLLLLGGLIAGPFFTLGWLVGGIGRQDYSPLRHPISSLAIGETGWIQSGTFVITAGLMLAFSMGVRNALGSDGVSPWTPIFLAGAGIGLLGAGLFVTDPMNGYPPGTPLIPTDFTIAGRLHRVFSALVFTGIPLAGFSSAKWLDTQGEASWATYSRLSAWTFLAWFVITTTAFLGAGGLDAIAGLLQRLTLLVGWLWVTLFAIRVLTHAQQPAKTDTHSQGLAA